MWVRYCIYKSTGSGSSWSRTWSDLLLNSVQEGCSDFLQYSGYWNHVFSVLNILILINTIFNAFYFHESHPEVSNFFALIPASGFHFRSWVLKSQAMQWWNHTWVQLNLCCENPLCMGKKHYHECDCCKRAWAELGGPTYMLASSSNRAYRQEQEQDKHSWCFSQNINKPISVKGSQLWSGLPMC